GEPFHGHVVHPRPALDAYAGVAPPEALVKQRDGTVRTSVGGQRAGAGTAERYGWKRVLQVLRKVQQVTGIDTRPSRRLTRHLRDAPRHDVIEVVVEAGVLQRLHERRDDLRLQQVLELRCAMVPGIRGVEIVVPGRTL